MSYYPKVSTTVRAGAASFNPLHFNLFQGQASLVTIGSPPPWTQIGSFNLSFPVTSIDFSSLSPSYGEYYLAYQNVTLSISDMLVVRLSTNNGSSFLNCSYQMGSGATATQNYSTLVRHTSSSSANPKIGWAMITNQSVKRISICGSDYGSSSNCGASHGIVESTMPITFIRLQATGPCYLTGGIVTLYGR